MADFFDNVKAIVLNTKETKSQKLQKLINDLKCTPKEAQNYYTIIQCVQGNEQDEESIRIARKRFTMGIEIECFGVNKSVLGAALSEQGIKSVATGYNHTDSKDTYKLGADGSINGNETCEVVSPVLRSLATLKVVCKVLNANGAKVNKSCGLHVHFGAEKFTLKEWVRIIINYANIEPVIDSFMALSRRGDNNCYCQSIRTGADRLKVTMVNSFSDIRSAFSYDRYHKVNVESFMRHKTIEFRQHQGTTDFTKIQNWVNFLGALVNYSLMNEAPIHATSIEELPFLNDKQKSYYKQRQQELCAF